MVFEGDNTGMIYIPCRPCNLFTLMQTYNKLYLLEQNQTSSLRTKIESCRTPKLLDCIKTCEGPKVSCNLTCHSRLKNKVIYIIFPKISRKN